MTEPHALAVPYLVVLTPGPDQGRRFAVAGEHLILGRAESSDVRLNDLGVSRTHAALRQRDGVVNIQDLGSSGGTFVNGVTVVGPRELHAGDVVSLAAVQLRYEGGGANAESQTRTMSAATSQAPRPGVPTGSAVVYDVGRQRADSISNVGGDQYNSYVQHVAQQRESFLREIAATRTKARRLMWTGFLLLVVGFGLYFAGFFSFAKQLENIGPNNDPTPKSMFGGGFTVALAGEGVVFLGFVVLVVGIVLHIVAVSRRKRVDRELAILPPWRTPGS